MVVVMSRDERSISPMSTDYYRGGSITWAALSRRTDARVLASGIWVFIVIAWAMSHLLRRDAWTPASVSTAAFLDLSILRCRRRREAALVQGFLYVLILVFDLAWTYVGREPQSRDILSFLTSAGVVWLWPVTAALGFAALRWHQRLSRELETLMRVRVCLDDDTAQPQGEQVSESQIKNVKGFGKRRRRGGSSATS